MGSDRVPTDRPNVLVFFCDQLRRDLLDCYGDTLVRTPHIDALAAEAVVFDQYYTPTPICSPARASLMTGLYPHEHHMFNNSSPRYSYCEHLRPDVWMLPDWIATETNYESAYFGKWHIGPAEDLYNSRFEHTQQPDPSRPAALNNSHWHPNTSLGPLVQSVGDGKAGTLDVPMEGFPDVVAARLSQDFLRSRDTDRPFALFCAFPGPHSPWMVPDEFGIRYKPEDIPIWPNRYDRFEGKPLYQRKLRLLDDLKNPHTVAEADLQALLACCFSYLELIDDMVGEVVATLKEEGLYDQTAIVFTTDHGDMAKSHGYISKGGYPYQEIYHLPMLFKPPTPSESRTTGGHRRVSAPANHMDVTATLLHLMAGEEQERMGPQQLHGKSLLPLLQGSDWYKSVHYAEFHGDWFGHYSSRFVTDGRWKLVWNLGDLCELYDLQEDPHELANRFYDPAYRAVRDRYFDVLLDEAQRYGDGQVGIFSATVEQQIVDLMGQPLPQ